jgi:hypothetical protein
MKLPNSESAIIPPEKIRDYLLSPSHPVGRYKAAFLRSHGYGLDGWEILEKDIRSLLPVDARLLETTEFGKKYKISGNITGPNGRMFGMTTIWIILRCEYIPRQVTAYPED